ncbi:hypothetical protein [Catellatospora citrea]|uniref:hypothetical protein n=1 Tax=Catellatospora citrea TaxID=53366 RepID=UPI000FED575E|nr:hypothetical protein [Catellatospora citrea]RKE10802.1 hypothetical protein C8E86_5721 [Catellatospora citrea]
MTLPPPPNPPGYPGAAPWGPGVGAPPPPPKKNNTPLILGLIAGVVVLCLIGLCVGGLVYNIVNDDGSPSAGPSLSTQQTGRPAPSDRYSPPEVVPTTEAALPAPAAVGDCVSVDVKGAFLGLGNCNGSRGTYRVLSVDRAQGTCSDPDGPWITTGGYRLCLELYLVRNYCYKLPTETDFAVPATKCKDKGTVHIVDIVPGGANGDKCTQDYKWNHWYRFTHPTVVYCVMRY